MQAQRKTIYLVEGEDEKKIVQMLIYVYISTEINRICRPVPLVEGKLRHRPGYHTLFFKA